ncbi:hypothetical protein Tco_0631587 [Tanacetum coccineum]
MLRLWLTGGISDFNIRVFKVWSAENTRSGNGWDSVRTSSGLVQPSLHLAYQGLVASRLRLEPHFYNHLKGISSQTQSALPDNPSSAYKEVESSRTLLFQLECENVSEICILLVRLFALESEGGDEDTFELVMHLLSLLQTPFVVSPPLCLHGWVV